MSQCWASCSLLTGGRCWGWVRPWDTRGAHAGPALHIYLFLCLAQSETSASTYLRKIRVFHKHLKEVEERLLVLLSPDALKITHADTHTHTLSHTFTHTDTQSHTGSLSHTHNAVDSLRTLQQSNEPRQGSSFALAHPSLQLTSQWHILQCQTSLLPLPPIQQLSKH